MDYKTLIIGSYLQWSLLLFTSPLALINVNWTKYHETEFKINNIESNENRKY